MDISCIKDSEVPYIFFFPGFEKYIYNIDILTETILVSGEIYVVLEKTDSFIA